MSIGAVRPVQSQCLYSTSTPLLPLWAVRPVQNLSTYSTVIPLLSLWAVRPVQRLCARTVQLNLYYPYGPYGLYRASLPVQYSYNSTPHMGRTPSTDPQSLYSTSLLLLPLRALRPVQSLSACTVQLYLYSPQYLYSTAIPLLPSVTVQYSYTSTPPMGRTAFTEPQCLYSTAIPLLPSVPVQYSSTSTPLSACTIQLYLYSPYGPYGLYRASVPVQGCTLP